MTQALKMDPGNTDAIEKNLELVGQRAVEASSRLNQLKRAVKDVGSQKVSLEGGEQSVKTIKQLSDETEDAALRASRAKEAYGQVVEQLARVKSEIQGLTGVDLDKELNPDETVESLRRAGQITDELASKYSELRTAYHEAFNENETAKAVNGFEDLRVEVTRTEAEVNSLSRQFSELSRESAMGQFGNGLDDQLKQIDSAAKQASDSLERASKALELDPTNVSAAEQKMRSLAESSDLSQMKVDLLRQKLARMDEAGIGKAASETRDIALEAERAASSYEEATAQVVRCKGEIESMVTAQNRLSAAGDFGDEYKELTSSIEGARQELARLEAAQDSAKSSMDTAQQVQEYNQLKTAIAEAESEASGFKSQMKGSQGILSSMSGALMSLGLSLSTSVTPALASLVSYAIQSASDIDSAYRDMRKTVNGTEEDFVALRDAAIDFSMTNVTSADQILSIQAIGGELGVATKDLQTFSETVSNLDVATNINAEDAAADLGQLSNILNDLNGDTMPNFADALVRLGNNGASTESQIADISSRMGAMASIVGMTTPEILAWSSTIASTGQGAEAAGTAISNTIRDIETAVAKGGDDLQAFADVAGMSAKDFASAWESSPSDAMYAFIQGLNRIEDDGGSALVTLSELGINAARQTQTIQGLMQMINGTSDGVTSLADNLRMSEDAWNGVSDEWGEAGDAAREAGKKAEGFSGSIQILQNTAQALAAEFGESLAPAIKLLTDILQGAYGIVENLPDGFKQTVVAVGGMVAALGPAILLFRSIGEFAGDLKKISTGMKTASKAADGLGSAVSGAATGLGGLKGALIGLGIGAVAAGVTALVSQFSKMQEEERLAERATIGLSEACKAADASMAQTSDSTKSAAENLRDMQEANDGTRERLADLADQFDDLNATTGATIQRLDDARYAIENYAGSGNLTAQEVGELKSAIEYLNSELGTNYSVVRDSDGTYQVMEDGAIAAKDAIYELIEAQKQQAIATAQQQKLESLYEEQAKALDTYNEAYQKYADAMARYNSAEEGSYEWGAAHDEAMRYKEEVDEAAESLDGLNENIDSVNESLGNQQAAASGAYEGLDKLLIESQGVEKALGSDSDVILDFSDALEEAGISVDYLSTLTDRQLGDLANQWKASGGDMAYAMEQAGIHTTQAAQDINNALSSMSNGEVAAALEASGVNIYQFSEAMANAGISAEQLNAIGSENFAALAANCGGNIDTLIWMLQNYNAQPIYDKNGNITADTTQLIDAQGQVYTWNGTRLLTQSGGVVMSVGELTDANGDVAQWNDSGQLVDKNGNVYVNDSQLTDASGKVLTWNGTNLVDQDGNVYIDEVQLTDCLGNMVTWNGTTLKKIDGDVYCDYSELTAALSSIDALKRQDGYTATVHVNTVQTTTKRTVVEAPTTSGGGTSRSRMALPMSRAALASTFASPVAKAANDISSMASDHTVVSSPMPRQSAVRVASAIASNSDMYALSAERSALRSVGRASKSQKDQGTYIENVEFNQKVVSADEDVYVKAPAAARSALRVLRRYSR